MIRSHLPPGSVEAAVLEMTAQSHRLRPASAAKQLNVSRAKLQKAIDRLEAAGLVFTAPNPHDERQRVVCLTDMGESFALHGRDAPPAEDLVTIVQAVQ